SPPSTVSVAGSTNGVSGDTVTLLCDDGAKSRTLLGPDIAVASDGSFSASVPLSDFSAAPGPCFLRAVPSGFDPYGGGDTSSYYGRQVTVARIRQRFNFASGPNAGKPADYYVFQQGTAAGSGYDSIANCGLYQSK